ncbi:MAG: response regulator transcription factor [Lachnospiraceae bacterium]|nr:response regulator transcription factor [Lachnospiraceae bacterium]
MNNNKYKVLLVEDDENITMLLSTMLETAGYQVVVAGTCNTAEMMFLSYVPDIIILDLGLPDKDGISFLKKVRENYLTPIIILSARSEEKTKVQALDLGANDYITKPFGSEELLARVRAILRSYRFSADEGRFPGGEFVLKNMHINYDKRKVFIDDTEIKLTQIEYNILALLSEQCGKLLTYATIIKAIWGCSDEGSIKKLQVNMANIRKKLGSTPGQNDYIVNEIGVGYRMKEENE